MAQIRKATPSPVLGLERRTAHGIAVTRETLRTLNRHPWRTLWPWLALSICISTAMLIGVLIVAYLSVPDPSGISIPGLTRPATLGSVATILTGNFLVLALHAFACVAGFIAGSSLPLSAAKQTGFSRVIHEKAGPFAIAFVAGATLFSLATQIYFLGPALATLAAQIGISDLHALLLVTPHALPELTALFLPLAAWLIASRRNDWDQLLGAMVITVAIAIPVLVVSAITEVTLFPDLLAHAR